MILARRLARLLKRHFGFEDIETAGGPAAGSEEAAKILGGLPEFLKGVNAALNENEDHLKMAMRNLSLSSAELTASNLALENLNMVNRAMLESLGQALLFFDHAGICGATFSQSCLTLLEGNPAGRHVADVLRLTGQAREDFVSLIEVMFVHNMTAHSFEELVALAPLHYEHSLGLTIALSYRAMYGPQGDVMGILLVATDVSAKARAQQELKQKEEQVMRTLRVAANRGSFLHFLRGIEGVFATIGDTHERAELKRELHTLKSMASFFYLHDMAKLIHELEDALMAPPEATWSADFSKLCADMRTRIDLSIDHARWMGREIWGDGFEGPEDIISVDTGRLLRFGKDLRKGLEDGSITPATAERMFFECVASLPVKELMGFFETQLSYFAEAAGRQVRVHYDAGDDVRIFPDFYREFFDSLTHIARNIVDHAAEPPLHRQTRGKPPELQVHIRASYEGPSRDKFKLTIADDGKGISVDKVAERLRDKKRFASDAKPAEIIQHIFDEDFSTRDVADMGSGRGIGMNVIKTEAQKLGGSVAVDSQEGIGTVLTVSLPVLWDRRKERR